MMAPEIARGKLSRARERIVSEGPLRFAARAARHIARRAAAVFLIIRHDLVMCTTTAEGEERFADDRRKLRLRVIGQEDWEQALSVGPADWARAIRERVQGTDTCVVGQIDGRVVVCAWCTPATPPCVLRRLMPAGDRAALLYGLYTAPEMRGQGLATECLHHIRRWLASQGYSLLWLKVAVTNAAALRCYRRTGFIEIGRERQVYLFGRKTWCTVRPVNSHAG